MPNEPNNKNKNLLSIYFLFHFIVLVSQIPLTNLFVFCCFCLLLPSSGRHHVLLVFICCCCCCWQLFSTLMALFLSNLTGIYTHWPKEKAQRKAFIETRQCIEARLRTQRENQQQVCIKKRKYLSIYECMCVCIRLHYNTHTISYKIAKQKQSCCRGRMNKPLYCYSLTQRTLLKSLHQWIIEFVR